MVFTRTKVVCTIGPSVNSVEKMIGLIHAGMDVARINFSHGSHEEHSLNISYLKEARETVKKPVAIMLDTRGPEIRIGTIHSNALETKPGMRLKLVAKASQASDQIPIHPFEALDSVKVGMTVLFDDGYVVSKIVEKEKNVITVEIQYAGVLKSHKKVNVPDAQLHLPLLTAEDIEDLKFGCAQDVDLIAASFVRSAHQIRLIKDLLAKEGKSNILVIAKIENHEGVDNIDSISQVADGIMVARGDLGVELDLALVPKLQKMMIRKCYQVCKPVITATQMLESMIVNPRPTRAEVSDVANAIYDCSSAVMLSGETAVGNFPIETVVRMKSIIKEAESDFDYRQFFDQRSLHDYHDPSTAISIAAVQTAYSVRASAIFVFTTSGRTAQLIARLRPEMPIIALTSDPKVYQQLSFIWGIIPLYSSNCSNIREAFEVASQYALKEKWIALGDIVVVTAGTPFGKRGSTNTMTLEHIGEVLVRGLKGVGPKVRGKISILLSPEDCDPESLRDRLVVILRCDRAFLPALKYASGIILQNFIDDSDSEAFAATIAKSNGISLICRADGAIASLQNDEIVTLDPQLGVVFRHS